jgi:hypothetical protein
MTVCVGVRLGVTCRVVLRPRVRSLKICLAVVLLRGRALCCSVGQG